MTEKVTLSFSSKCIQTDYFTGFNKDCINFLALLESLTKRVKKSPETSLREREKLLEGNTHSHP